METVPHAASKPCTKSELTEEWIDQEIFLYDPENGDAVQCLNSGAALIWLLCDGTRDEEGIAREIAAAFGLPNQQVLGQVQETVEQLSTLNLMETCESASKSAEMAYNEKEGGTHDGTTR